MHNPKPPPLATARLPPEPTMPPNEPIGFGWESIQQQPDRFENLTRPEVDYWKKEMVEKLDWIRFSVLGNIVINALLLGAIAVAFFSM